MKHKMIAFPALLLLAIILSACGSASMPLPTLTPVSTPTLMPTSTLTSMPTRHPAEETFNLAEECAHRWENTQKSDDLGCAIRCYQEAIDLSDDDIQRQYFQFRFDRLLWLSGQREAQVRERILDSIRHNFDNEEAAEFFWGKVLPEPQPIDIGATFIIYEDSLVAPHLKVAHPDVQLEVANTSLPGNLYEGSASLKIDWNKRDKTWASLVIGFDPSISQTELAEAGTLKSLSLDRASRNDYRLEFAAKAGAGIAQWREPIMRLKLQDQNLIIRESLGNQLVCHIKLTEEWTVYSIPLGEFITDRWILELYADDSQGVFDNRPWLAFDWSRVKQINFDVPYRARGSGTILLDNIQLVRTDADGIFGESQWWPQAGSIITTCLDLPGFLPEE